MSIFVVLQVSGAHEGRRPSALMGSCRYINVLMKDEKEGRNKQARSNKQHSTPKAVTFPKLPHVGLKPTTLYTPDRALYH